MTRALCCVFHGRLVEAYHYNPLVILVFPLLSFTWFKTVLRLWKEIRDEKPRTWHDKPVKNYFQQS